MRHVVCEPDADVAGDLGAGLPADSRTQSNKGACARCVQPLDLYGGQLSNGRNYTKLPLSTVQNPLAIVEPACTHAVNVDGFWVLQILGASWVRKKQSDGSRTTTRNANGTA